MHKGEEVKNTMYDFEHVDALWEFAVQEFGRKDLREKSYAIDTVQAHYKDFLKAKKDRNQILEMLSVVFVAQNSAELISAGFTTEEIEAKLRKHGGSIRQAQASSPA